MFDNKKNNHTAIKDFSQTRKPVFKLPSDEKRTVNRGSNSNYTYMIFGILAFVLVSVLIYIFISYLFLIKSAIQLMIWVTTLVVIFLIAAILIKVVYPRRPIEKDGSEDDL
jgi:fatty acid desaturase